MPVMKKNGTSSRWKRFAIWSGLGGLFGLISVLFAMGAYVVRVLTRPKVIRSVTDTFAFTPFEIGLPAEEVQFAPRKGTHRVDAWYIPHPGANETIIVSPGYRGQRADMLGISGQLWKAGYTVLVIEYYGHGQATGKPVTLGYREVEDFLGAVAYARQRAPENRMGAIGYSMGAAVTLLGAAQAPEIEVIVADSPFATHRSVLALAVSRKASFIPFILLEWAIDLNLRLKAGYGLRDVEPIRVVDQIRKPIFFIHGDKDSIVPHEDSLLLFHKAPEPKEYWSLEGVDHCGAYFADRPHYVKRVLNFFAEHFQAKPQARSTQSKHL